MLSRNHHDSHGLLLHPGRFPHSHAEHDRNKHVVAAVIVAVGDSLYPTVMPFDRTGGNG